MKSIVTRRIIISYDVVVNGFSQRHIAPGSTQRADLRSRAASWSPARAIDGEGAEGDTCSGVEGRTRPRATDEQSVGGGQGSVPENVAHVRDARQIEAERLIERKRALPRVSQAGLTVRGELPAAGGWKRRARPRCTHKVHNEEGARLQITRGCWAREALTQNMPYMSVTRVVSKFRGWLKLSACCRGSKAGHVRRVWRAVRAAREAGQAAGDRGVLAACVHGGGRDGRPHRNRSVRGQRSSPRTCRAWFGRRKCPSGRCPR